MKIKAAFIDIDGTLLNSHFEIDRETRNCLLAFQKAGGRIILSSARPYVGMKKYGEELELSKHGGCYSAFNGGQIVDAATLETIYEKTFSTEDIKNVFDTVQQLENEAQGNELSVLQKSYQGENCLTRELAWAVHEAIDKSSLNIITYRGNELLAMRQEVYAVAEMLVNQMALSVQRDFLGAMDFLPAKFLVSGNPILIQKVYPLIKEKLNIRCDVVTSDPFFIEITPAEINKGSSMETLVGTWGIPLEAVAAFGDSENDISMLQKAGIGVAMGNAPDAVKRSAKFITGSNDDNGIARFLETYFG